MLVVPYFLPVRVSLSDSYAFGFNNHGAVVGWVLFSLAFAYWYGPIPADETTQEAPKESTRRPLWAMLSLATVLHLALWMASFWYGPLQEARYLMDRLQHLASGERVFRDFEMAYGAGILYLPLWFSRCLHMSLLNAYSLALLLEQLAGILLLWYVVQAVANVSPYRDSIFVLLCLTCLAWTPLFPAQYTALRYWIGPAIAVCAYHFAIDRDQRLLALVVLTGGFGLTLLLFQEQAIALFGGVLLFSVLFLHGQWRRFLPGLVVFAAMAGTMLWIAYSANGLETLINIGRGAYAEPIGPAPILVPILGLLLAAACVFVEAIRCRSRGSLQTLLLCLSPFSLNAAFGRFDPAHLPANTLVATFVAWTALSRNAKWWRLALAVYVFILFIFPTQLPIVYGDDLKLALQAPRHDPHNEQQRPGLPTFYSPIGPISPQHIGEPLPFNYYTGRFYGQTDLITPHQADELVAEIRSKGNAPMLMAPSACVWSGSRKSVMLYTTAVYFPKARHTNADLHAICDEINANYERVTEPGLELPSGLYLVRRKMSAPLP